MAVVPSEIECLGNDKNNEFDEDFVICGPSASTHLNLLLDEVLKSHNKRAKIVLTYGTSNVVRVGKKLKGSILHDEKYRPYNKTYFLPSTGRFEMARRVHVADSGREGLVERLVETVTMQWAYFGTDLFVHEWDGLPDAVSHWLSDRFWAFRRVVVTMRRRIDRSCVFRHAVIRETKKAKKSRFRIIGRIGDTVTVGLRENLNLPISNE